MAVCALGGGRYTVETESGATYVVDLPARRCSCPDHAIRGERCKHLRRVAIEITGRRIAPPGKHAATCIECGKEAFVADTTRLAVCGDCALRAGDRVRDRETGHELRVVALTDRRADEVAIPAADATVAEYPTNLRYESDQPVVEAVYPTDGDAEDSHRSEPRRYSFPLSRLERIEAGDSDGSTDLDVAGSALVAGS